MVLRLAPTLEAPREARKGLSALSAELDEDTHAALIWVVSELVAISVAEGGSDPIEVRLSVNGEVEGIVEDHGVGTRAMLRAREEQEPPLVLRVVDALTEEWTANPEQTRICFRILRRRGGDAG